MTKKYTPATFQPTIRPSWAGILSYIDANEKAEILDAIICFPNECLGGVKSRFYNETIKPDLYEQYDKFLKICDIRGRSAKTYWGEQKLSKSLTCDKHKDNLLKDKDKDKDKVKDKVKDNQEGGNRGKPTIQEVIDYCNERNNGVDANKWYDYYTANGWKVGRNPMKDWKATVRTWEKNTPQQPKQEQSERKFLIAPFKFFIDDDEKNCPGYADLVKQLPESEWYKIGDWITNKFYGQEIGLSTIRAILTKAIQNKGVQNGN